MNLNVRRYLLFNSDFYWVLATENGAIITTTLFRALARFRSSKKKAVNLKCFKSFDEANNYCRRCLRKLPYYKDKEIPKKLRLNRIYPNRKRTITISQIYL